MASVADETKLIEFSRAGRVLPRDNVVHISKNMRGRWVGTFVTGALDKTVTVSDEFATFAMVLEELKKTAKGAGVSRLYYKKI